MNVQDLLGDPRRADDLPDESADESSAGLYNWTRALDDFMKTRNTKVLYSVAGSDAGKTVSRDSNNGRSK